MQQLLNVLRRRIGSSSRNSLAIVLIVGLVMSLGACALPFGLDRTSWQEEVLLHDGRTIVIDRSQTYGGRREIGQPPPIREHTISFTLPNTGKNVTWVSEYGEELGRANFDLLALHVLNGVPYIVARPNLCLSYNKWGRPNPPYVFFKFDGAAWQRIPLAQFPAEFKTINVARSIRGRDGERLVSLGLVSAEKIAELNSRTRQPEYKTILREALANSRCPQYSSGPKAPNPNDPDVPSK